MAGINASAIKAVEAKKKEWMAEIEGRCKLFCEALCQAAIRYRESAPGKHDFTGNLLNSIIVCLYDSKKSPIHAVSAADKVPKAIFTKMTAPHSYAYSKDYEGSGSYYKAEVETNQGWGADDAKNFFTSYKPQGNNMFTIVVAYPTEYAEWVEIKRGTTGIMGTYDMASRLGIDYLRLPQVS